MSEVNTESVNPEVEDKICFERTPMNIECPNCKKRVLTEIKYQKNEDYLRVGMKVLLVGALVPLLVKRFKNVKHICPNCQHQIGIKYAGGKHVQEVEKHGETFVNGGVRIAKTGIKINELANGDDNDNQKSKWFNCHHDPDN